MPRTRRVAVWLVLVAGAGGVYQFAQENHSKPLGGDIIPLRQVSDPYPVFNGIAVDPVNNIVAMSDVNKKSLLSYGRTLDPAKSGITPPRRQIFGPLTNIGFIAGVMLDPQRREIYAVNNDIEDTMVVMPYDAQGNAEPFAHSLRASPGMGTRHEPVARSDKTAKSTRPTASATAC